MSMPYFPLYPADFEAGTSHLTLEEDGAYNRLLRLMWMTPGCTLPDDPAWISRRMRLDRDTFDRIVAPIIAEFFRHAGGRIVNDRLKREHEKVSETYKKRSAAGKKGGRPKAFEITKDDQKAGLSQEKAGSNQPEPEPEPESSSNARTPDQAFRERLIIAAGSHPCGVNPATGRPTAIGDPADMQYVSAWQNDLNLTESEIISVIKGGAARKRGAPASTLRFFDGHMQDFASEKQKCGFAPTSKPAEPFADPKAEAERLKLVNELGRLRGSNSDAAFVRRGEIVARMQALTAEDGAN